MMIIKCNYCKKNAVLVTGDVIYPNRKDLYNLNFWLCTSCNAYVGCRKGSTKPLGSLADATLRIARANTHKVFDPVWKNNKSVSRTQAYAWLAKCLNLTTNECHIALFNEELCEKTIKLCKNLNKEICQ